MNGFKYYTPFTKLIICCDTSLNNYLMFMFPMSWVSISSRICRFTNLSGRWNDAIMLIEKKMLFMCCFTSKDIHNCKWEKQLSDGHINKKHNNSCMRCYLWLVYCLWWVSCCCFISLRPPCVSAITPLLDVSAEPRSGGGSAVCLPSSRCHMRLQTLQHAGSHSLSFLAPALVNFPEIHIFTTYKGINNY